MCAVGKYIFTGKMTALFKVPFQTNLSGVHLVHVDTTDWQVFWKFIQFHSLSSFAASGTTIMPLASYSERERRAFLGEGKRWVRCILS